MANAYVSETKKHEVSVEQAGHHPQSTIWMTIFPSFAAFTASFMETLQLWRDLYLSWQS